MLEGYIIPIHGIFESIQQISGATNIRLPSLEESLVQASRCGYRELVEELSLKLPMSLYQDALLGAAAGGNVAVVEMLLQAGAYMNATASPINRRTAL